MNKGIKRLVIVLSVFAVLSVTAFAGLHMVHPFAAASEGYDPDLVDMVPEQAAGTVPAAGQDVPQDTSQTSGGSFLGSLLDMDVMNGRDVSNILLIGQDAREGEEQQRSDAMILASINKRTKQITLISLMRDMYVEIPGYGKNRINAAFSLGGAPLLMETISRNFGISIDHYIEVDLEGFLQVMSSVGNLPVELTQEEADYLNANDSYGSTDNSISTADKWSLTAGLNYLTPEQALAYSRIRYVGNSDYERTERQRKVLISAFENLSQADIFSLVGLVTDAMKVAHSDLSLGEIIGYGNVVLTSDLGIGETHRIPADGTYTSEIVDGMDVLVPDLAANTALLQSYVS